MGIITRRESAGEQVFDSEGFFDDSEGFFDEDVEDGELDQGGDRVNRSGRSVWTRWQFGLAALSATPLLFIGGLGGWPWDPDTAPSAEAPVAVGEAGYPATVSLSRLDIEASTDPLGTDPVTRAPSRPDPGRAGWYVAGPEPGELGRAVMFAGRGGSADEFARLPDTRVGDRIAVRTAAGTELTFVVRTVEQFLTGDLPIDRIYGGPAQEAQLRLISATGAYDAKSGYPRQVVVFADLLT